MNNRRSEVGKMRSCVAGNGGEKAEGSKLKEIATDVAWEGGNGIGNAELKKTREDG